MNSKTSITVPDWLDDRQVFSNEEARLITGLKYKELKNFRDAKIPLAAIQIDRKLYFPVVPFLGWFKRFHPDVSVNFELVKERPHPLASLEFDLPFYAGHTLREIANLCGFSVYKTRTMLFEYLRKQNLGIGKGCRMKKWHFNDFVYEVLDAR